MKIAVERETVNLETGEVIKRIVMIKHTNQLVRAIKRSLTPIKKIETPVKVTDAEAALALDLVSRGFLRCGA